MNDCNRKASAQVVVANSASIRMSSPGRDWHHTKASLLNEDMPRPIPLSRWDAEDTKRTAYGNKAPVRFGSFISGTVLTELAIAPALSK